MNHFEDFKTQFEQNILVAKKLLKELNSFKKNTTVNSKEFSIIAKYFIIFVIFNLFFNLLLFYFQIKQINTIVEAHTDLKQTNFHEGYKNGYYDCKMLFKDFFEANPSNMREFEIWYKNLE